MKFLGDIARAIAQLSDPAFQRVLWTGIGLTVLLLVGLGAATVWGLNWLLPDTVSLPFIGTIGWLDDIASGLSVVGLMILSVFLMMPVASVFTGFLLDDVTDAVEAKHYPNLTPAPRLSIIESIRDGAGFLGVLIAANLMALIAYLIVPPFAPFIFYALNGFLLGREYIQLIATRRLGPEGAAALRARHPFRIWAAGCLMAVPLTIPIVNLTVPLLGAASFTHLFHRIAPRGATSGRTSRYPER
ncbi:CysZ-like protein [Rhodobacteraceae bacterium THAF1]|uniref:EI24 domain-containing protein n=1 Tax=Palleronia sp. THAF1 TaxID=2587842 RepID=UPI000F3DB8D4|nr:EI24 domain-containing protein [Palleronia sp. THAF1]QFU07363.1 CysZ-like protein [Palleronia sp. THAF1]VDC20725.1 CysZ-like protein [Rhodobacteraceae bacterium THAF1]